MRSYAIARRKASLGCIALTCLLVYMYSLCTLPKPTNVNYIGYGNITQLSTNYTLAWGTGNNLLSTTIAKPVVYDRDAQIAYSYTTGYTNNYVRTSGISLAPTTSDINCLFCQFIAGHINLKYSY